MHPGFNITTPKKSKFLDYISKNIYFFGYNLFMDSPGLKKEMIKFVVRIVENGCLREVYVATKDKEFL